MQCPIKFFVFFYQLRNSQNSILIHNGLYHNLRITQRHREKEKLGLGSNWFFFAEQKGEFFTCKKNLLVILLSNSTHI